MPYKRIIHQIAYAFLTAYAFASPVLADNPVVEGNGIRVKFERGHQLQLCREYADGLIEWGVDRNSYFGVPIPSKNPHFRLVEGWESLNPHDHMDIVKDIVFWSSAVEGGPWSREEFLERSYYRTTPDPEMFDTIWGLMREHVLEFIETDYFSLQRKMVDLNFDQIRDPVYRMTPIVRSRRYTDEGPVWTVRVLKGSHRNLGLPGADRLYTYYVSPDYLPQMHKSVRRRHQFMDLFWYKGRIYIQQGSAVYEPRPGKSDKSQGCLRA